jgi:exodeoxyribonuclease VII large subunit
VAKVEPVVYGDRKVFTVASFNRGVAIWLRRLPEVWIEGELTELRRNPAWATVFFTLKDPATGATMPATMARRRFDALGFEPGEGEKVHVQGRAELYEQRGALGLRASTIERFGLGEHLAALERLKLRLAAEGLFAAERKRPLPRFPRAVGVLTGADAAARGDVVTALCTRFPPARVVVAETRVQGAGAPGAIVSALAALAAHPRVDVVVVTRGGGSFEDLLPFSDERVVRAFAACPVPVVSAVGHEQDTPLCDLAADVRASTPTAAARLLVPDLDELLAGLERARERLGAGLGRLLERRREQLVRTGARLRAAPRLVVERRRAALAEAGGRLRTLSPQATLDRGYAIVRTGGIVLRSAADAAAGDEIDVRLARSSLAATVTAVREDAP